MASVLSSDTTTSTSVCGAPLMEERARVLLAIVNMLHITAMIVHTYRFINENIFFYGMLIICFAKIWLSIDNQQTPVCINRLSRKKVWIIRFALSLGYSILMY
jgi:hypothetical protein